MIIVRTPLDSAARNHLAEGERFARELLQGTELPDAIAAMSDELALGALRGQGLIAPGQRSDSPPSPVVRTSTRSPQES
jgi:DNA-binding LacI/PurR family transcriptional regulator